MCPPRPRHVSCQPWPGSSCSRLSVRLLCCQFWVFWISPCHTGFPDGPVNVTVQVTCLSKLQNQPNVVQISNTLSAARGGDLRPSPRLRPCWWTWALRLCRRPRGVCARGSRPCGEAAGHGGQAVPLSTAHECQRALAGGEGGGRHRWGPSQLPRQQWGQAGRVEAGSQDPRKTGGGVVRAGSTQKAGDRAGPGPHEEAGPILWSQHQCAGALGASGGRWPTARHISLCAFEFHSVTPIIYSTRTFLA